MSMGVLLTSGDPRAPIRKGGGVLRAIPGRLTAGAVLFTRVNAMQSKPPNVDNVEALD